MDKKWEDRAAEEIVAFLGELLKPWVHFKGHEHNIAEIIRRHMPPVTNGEQK